MALIAPVPPGAGCVMWNASSVAPYPASSARISAPRFKACSSDSTTRIPAPSLRTNPSLSASKGRLALVGLSQFWDSARILANPAIVNGVILASVPPASIISASPYLINLRAIPIASVAEAHAEVTV